MTPEDYPDTPAFREAAAARRRRDDPARFEAFQRVLDAHLGADDVPVLPGFPQGRTLTVCPTCHMKAPIRACGCAVRPARDAADAGGCGCGLRIPSPPPPPHIQGNPFL